MRVCIISRFFLFGWFHISRLGNNCSRCIRKIRLECALLKLLLNFFKFLQILFVDKNIMHLV